MMACSARQCNRTARTQHTYQVFQGLFAAALPWWTPAAPPSCPGAHDSTPTAAESPAAEAVAAEAVAAEAPAAEMYFHVLTEAAAGWVQGMSGTSAAAAAWHALGLLAGCWLCCHWRSGETAPLHLALQPVAAAERVERVPRFVPLEGHLQRAGGAWVLLQAERAGWGLLPWRQSLDLLVARWLQAEQHLSLTDNTITVLGTDT